MGNKKLNSKPFQEHTNPMQQQNVEMQYSMMLLAGCLIRVVKVWDDGALPNILPSDLMAYRVPLVTLQIMIRTLSTQNSDGSWKNSPEITAYAILTVKKLASLPWIQSLDSQINDCLALGTIFLEKNEETWQAPEFIWVEKVTYGSKILSETYCVAALNASKSFDKLKWGENALGIYKLSTQRKVHGFSRFFTQLPVFAEEPAWRLHASIIEGYLFAPLLKDVHVQLDIFPRENSGTEKYLEYIPLTWTTCNNATGLGITSQTMREMMIISILNFQVDKYLEDITGNEVSQEYFKSLKSVIRGLISDDDNNHSNKKGVEEEEPNDQESQFHHGNRKRRKIDNGPSHSIENGARNGDHSSEKSQHKLRFVKAEKTLSRFVAYVLNHPRVTGSSGVVRRQIKEELSTFLQAHVTHGEHNAKFQSMLDNGEHIKTFTNTTGTYYDWVRTTSADHTSCPYSFAFFTSLIMAQQGPHRGAQDCFSGIMARYLAQDVCRHLATMCRQYNDYGSFARDRMERNLNSVNFSEFHENSGLPTKQEQISEDSIRRKLLEIANYERECLDIAFKRLKGEIEHHSWRALEVFIKVTDLYGQIYVLRDINA